MNTSSKINSNLQAHLSKLHNKKSQLENLLRHRARLDYEIQKLKKSIRKDSKRQERLHEEASSLKANRYDDQLICESLQISGDDHDSEEELELFFELYNDYSNELYKITDMLLEYPES